jgi:hypothetical protein
MVVMSEVPAETADGFTAETWTWELLVTADVWSVVLLRNGQDCLRLPLSPEQAATLLQGYEGPLNAFGGQVAG